MIQQGDHEVIERDAEGAITDVLLATWEDAALYRGNLTSPVVPGEELVFKYYEYHVVDGHRYRENFWFIAKDGGQIESYVSVNEYFDKGRMFGRIRWALNEIGLIDQAKKLFAAAEIAAGRSDPMPIVVERKTGEWSESLVDQASQILSDCVRIYQSSGRDSITDTTRGAKLDRIAEELVAGIGAKNAVVSIWFADDDSWASPPSPRARIAIVSGRMHLWARCGTDFRRLWSSFWKNDEALTCPLVFLEPAEVEAWAERRMLPGVLTLTDELEIFRLLSEPTPYSWEQAQFVEWAAERWPDPQVS